MNREERTNRRAFQQLSKRAEAAQREIERLQNALAAAEAELAMLRGHTAFSLKLVGTLDNTLSEMESLLNENK